MILSYPFITSTISAQLFTKRQVNIKADLIVYLKLRF